MSELQTRLETIEKDLGTFLGELAASTDLGEAIRLESRLLRVLQDNVSAVSEVRRRAVRGLKINGFSYKQIGDLVGLHKQTVVVIDKGRG